MIANYYTQLSVSYRRKLEKYLDSKKIEDVYLLVVMMLVYPRYLDFSRRLSVCLLSVVCPVPAPVVWRLETRRFFDLERRFSLRDCRLPTNNMAVG